MPLTVNVTDDLMAKVNEFVQAQALPWQLAATGGSVRIVASGPEPEQCTPDTLRAGGWMVCSDAFTGADLLDVPRRTMGKLLDHLDIKLKSCQLGCF